MARGKEVKKLSDLFERYRHTLKAPEGSVIREFCAVVSELLSIEIPEQKVTYRPSSRLLSLQRGGPLKQEILLHKSDILAHLKGRLGQGSAPKDII